MQDWDSYRPHDTAVTTSIVQIVTPRTVQENGLHCKIGNSKFVLLTLGLSLQVGDWRAVQEKCHLGKIQPSVLFYQATFPAPAKHSRKAVRN